MSNPSIEEVYKFLNSSYRYIDFRIALYKEGEEWKYVTSIFRFTNKSKEEISAIHDNLRELPHRTENFDIIFKILNKKEWKKYWEDIKSKIAKIDNGFDISNLKFSQNFRNQRSMHLSDIDWDIDSIQYNFYLKEREAHHNRFKFLEENKEMRKIGNESMYPIIEKCLQIEDFNLNDPLFSLILFPIYIKFDNLQYINNYLKGTLIYHEIFNDSIVFFDFIDTMRKSIGIRREFDLKTAKKEIKGDNLNIITFIQNFSDINLKNYQTEPQLDFKLYFKDLNINLIHFNLYPSSITQRIKNLEKIPEEILNLIKPILKMNLLNRENFREERRRFIENVKGNERNFIKIIEQNLEWLLDFKTPIILKAFFISAANQNNVGYHNVFKEFIVYVSEEALINNIIEDNELKVKINDLIILNSVLGFHYYQVKLSTVASLTKIKDEISYITNRILRKPMKCMGQDFHDRRLFKQLGYEFPYISYECKLDLSGKIFCSLYFIENNPEVFQVGNIFIIFYLPSDLKNIWKLLDQETTETVVKILNEIFKLSTLKIENVQNIPHNILKALKNVPQLDVELAEQDLEWIKEKKFIISRGRTKNIDFKFKDFNIFVGKNNSGKTFALSMCFYDISGDRYYDNDKQAKKFSKQFPNFLLSEIYYIPNHRILAESIGDTIDIKSELILFFNTLVELQSDKFVKKESASIEDQTTQNNKNERFEPWKIPNFISNLDICALESGKEADLTHDDRQIIDNGEALLSNLKRIFNSWKRQIKKSFPDIQINKIRTVSRGLKRSVLIRDEFINHDITNWNWYGSGTKQLLNLIFLIEYLKYGPLVDYKGFLTELNIGNIEDAFNKYVKFERNNRVIFIDEPDISLHPSLQRAFFEYLFESSKFIQIFVATQSPFFLDIKNFDNLLENKIMVRLFVKKENGEFANIPITKYNKILIIDEIFQYNPIETAFYLSKNDNSNLLITNKQREFNLLELKMINKMIKSRSSPNYLDLLQLGTFYEEINPRLIQNAHFLIVEPTYIDLTEKTELHEDWEQIFIYQINKSKYKCNAKKRLEGVIYSCWNPKIAITEMVLTYTDNQSEDLTKKILDTLNLHETNENCKIIENKSIIVFPENSIPYSLLNNMIEFAIKNKIVIIGGMEDRNLHEIEEIIEELSNKFSNKYHRGLDYYSLRNYPPFEEKIYINQAIIINSNGCFSFQIKNVPVYFKNSDRQENIPIILNPTFFKFKTTIGDIAVFICKDFLVNYSVIDRWMDKNNVSLIAVPSFTELVNPFRSKFSQIIHQDKNRKKTFIFTNIAEFGGSGIYNFNRERDYEPGKKSPFEAGEEICKSFIKNKKDF